jgi:hypothetical protein
MDDKIKVRHYVDSDEHPRYEARGVSEYSLSALSKVLGVSEDQFAVYLDEKLIRQRRLSEQNKRSNTPDAIRRRSDFDVFDV